MTNQVVEEANFEEEEDSFSTDIGGQQQKYVQKYRDCLPALKNPDQKVSIWKIIKDSVGQDLSRVTVPVYFNEPLSMLQKFAEVMEYQ